MPMHPREWKKIIWYWLGLFKASRGKYDNASRGIFFDMNRPAGKKLYGALVIGKSDRNYYPEKEYVSLTPYSKLSCWQSKTFQMKFDVVGRPGF